MLFVDNFLLGLIIITLTLHQACPKHQQQLNTDLMSLLTLKDNFMVFHTMSAREFSCKPVNIGQYQQQHCTHGLALVLMNYKGIWLRGAMLDALPNSCLTRWRRLISIYTKKHCGWYEWVFVVNLIYFLSRSTFASMMS